MVHLIVRVQRYRLCLRARHGEHVARVVKRYDRRAANVVQESLYRHQHQPLQISVDSIGGKRLTRHVGDRRSHKRTVMSSLDEMKQSFAGDICIERTLHDSSASLDHVVGQRRLTLPRGP